MVNWVKLWPSSFKLPRYSSDLGRSFLRINSDSSETFLRPTRPVKASAKFKLIFLSDELSWSKIDSASRKLPSPAAAMTSRASLSISIFSALTIKESFSKIFVLGSFLKTKRWTREVMVGGSFSYSVVAKTKTAWAGGSSRVFKRALKAAPVNIWTSSMM